LLDAPAPKLRGYRHETVIAEKFEAIVKLGRANSRMKDFYDIWMLSREYEFTGDALARAIAATFARRKTDIPTDRPIGLTKAFADDPAKQQQWKSFAATIGAELPPLGEVIEELADFLMPHALAAASLPAAV
jgi:predicted nucleotidyltransferase component of viral defense system